MIHLRHIDYGQYFNFRRAIQYCKSDKSSVLAKENHQLYLAGRDETELKKIADDIHIRHGTEIFFCGFDIENISTHQDFFDKILNTILIVWMV